MPTSSPADVSREDTPADLPAAQPLGNNDQSPDTAIAAAPDLDEVGADGATGTAPDAGGAPDAAPPLPRHPATIVVAMALPAFAFAAFGFTAQGFVTAFASAVLVVLAAYDISQRILPNRILGPATAVLLVAQIAFFPDQAVEWIAAGIAASAFLAAPLVIRRDAMGMGDVKLGVFMGVATGWNVFTAMLVGCLALLPVALWMLARDGSIRGAKLPFGPFLALGTLVVLFAS